MRYLIFIALLISSSLAPAQYTAVPNPDGGVTITISAEQLAECQSEGGCGLVSVEWVARTIEREVRKTCGKEV